MEIAAIIKSLTIIPRLLVGALIGAFAGAISGGLGGGLYLALLGSLSALFLGNALNDPLPEVIKGLAAAFTLGAIDGLVMATVVGAIFGVLDKLFHGRLSSSLNSKRAWIVAGAPLGAIGGAVLLGLSPTMSNGFGPSYWIPAGLLFCLPSGAIAGPIFSVFYKPLAAPAYRVVEPALIK
jgi:hypothetical protein